VEWVIRYKNKLQTDAFFVARLEMMFLYLLIGGVIFMVFGWSLGSLTLKTVHDISVTQNGQPVEDAFFWYHQQVIVRRYIMATLFVVSSYFFADFALRPVRRTRDIQRRFVATVSHELRTPLTIIKNSSEIALRNSQNLSHEKAIQLIKSNLEEVDRMSKTIQFLLTYSLLREQKKVPNLESLSLSRVFEEVRELLEKIAHEHGVELEAQISKPAVVKGNRVALEGLLINLVKNAISHSPKGGVVLISITMVNSSVKLSVTDKGSGIHKDELPYIFEPFFRGKDEHKAKATHNGFGLGLSIVKEIVEYHNALLHIDSSKKNGTKFVVTF
jgi:signal transduction histidine kinase